MDAGGKPEHRDFKAGIGQNTTELRKAKRADRQKAARKSRMRRARNQPSDTALTKEDARGLLSQLTPGIPPQTLLETLVALQRVPEHGADAFYNGIFSGTDNLVKLMGFIVNRASVPLTQVKNAFYVLINVSGNQMGPTFVAEMLHAGIVPLIVEAIGECTDADLLGDMLGVLFNICVEDITGRNAIVVSGIDMQFDALGAAVPLAVSSLFMAMTIHRPHPPPSIMMPYIESALRMLYTHEPDTEIVDRVCDGVAPLLTNSDYVMLAQHATLIPFIFKLCATTPSSSALNVLHAMVHSSHQFCHQFPGVVNVLAHILTNKTDPRWLDPALRSVYEVVVGGETNVIAFAGSPLLPIVLQMATASVTKLRKLCGWILAHSLHVLTLAHNVDLLAQFVHKGNVYRIFLELIRSELDPKLEDMCLTVIKDTLLISQRQNPKLDWADVFEEEGGLATCEEMLDHHRDNTRNIATAIVDYYDGNNTVMACDGEDDEYIYF